MNEDRAESPWLWLVGGYWVSRPPPLGSVPTPNSLVVWVCDNILRQWYKLPRVTKSLQIRLVATKKYDPMGYRASLKNHLLTVDGNKLGDISLYVKAQEFVLDHQDWYFSVEYRYA